MKLKYLSLLPLALYSLSFSQDISKMIQKDTKVKSDSLEIIAQNFYDTYKNLTYTSTIPAFIDEELQVNKINNFSTTYSIQYVDRNNTTTYELCIDSKKSISLFLFPGIIFNPDLEDATEEISDLKFDGIDGNDIYISNNKVTLLKKSDSYLTIAKNYSDILDTFIGKLSYALWVCKDIEKENYERISAVRNNEINKSIYRKP